MTLSSGTLRNGTALSGFFCFTVDNGQPTTEYICGTASSTAVSSLTRGVDVLNPNSSSTSYAYSHRRFASVQISDYPTLQFLVRKANGTDAYDTKLQYSFTTTSTITSAGDIPNKAYVDLVGSSGCANADTSTRGCVELATTAETQAGTTTGGSGAALVPANSIFNVTPGANKAPVATSTGYLAQGWLNLTEAFVWSAQHTFNSGLISASSTFNGLTNLAGTTKITGLASGTLVMSGGSTSTISGLAPGASGTVVKSDGTNWLSGTIASLTNSTTTNSNITGTASETTLWTDTLPAATMGANGYIKIHVDWDAANDGGGAGSQTLRIKFGGTTMSTHARSNTSGGSSQISETTILNANSASSQEADDWFFANDGASASFKSFTTGATAAINTASAVTLSITGQLSNTAHHIRVDRVTVEAFPKS